MIVRFFDWDQPRVVDFSQEGIEKGDFLIIESNWGVFPAEVLILDKDLESGELAGEVIRKADSQDLRVIEEGRSKEEEILIETKKQARFLDLPMKIIDTKISLDGSCVVVAFVADGRVDFRRLVRDLSGKFGKSIRLQQIGSRDEARRCGGYGICGREVCCRKFSGSIQSISTEMARCQLISHRGSERISGLCGRLMCCLAFESKQYMSLVDSLPEKGARVELEGKAGVVTDVQVLTQKVKVNFEDGTISIVDESKLTWDKTKRV